MNKLDHTKYSINSALKDSNCSMLSPGYKYTRDDDFRRARIERKEENITKLEGIISQGMKKNYQEAIGETLEDTKPILYVDCAQKGDLDVMCFLLKEYERITPLNDKDKIIAKIIETRSIIIEPEQRKEYITTQQPNSEEIINHYNTLVQQKIKDLKPDHIQYILSCENDVAIAGLAALMEQQNKRHIYLYLDTTKYLSTEEQTRINFLLYARGGIDHNKWIHLKINNGDKSRKTRTASNGIRVEAIHDYSETNIYEEDIMEQQKIKEYSKTLELQGLNYETKREVLEQYEDELLEQVEHIKHGNALIHLLREILKNSADHTDGNINITLQLEQQCDQIKVEFSIYDDGPGMQSNTTRERKGQYNFGIGLGMIEELAKVYKLDLVLHNKGNIYHINDLGLQKDLSPNKKFGYQGIGVFEIKK